MKENIVRGNKKKSYIWNTVSGVINAGQSALILIFVSHNYTTYEVGLFSISYAIALLCMTLAKYGQRNYQVIDVSEKYTFQEYRISRWITIITTLALLSLYLVYQFIAGAYQGSKVLIVFFYVLWKMIDAAEDLYYGMYQQKDHLDIGAKRYSERLLISTFLFCALSYTRMPFSCLIIIVTAVSMVIAILLIMLDYKKIVCKNKGEILIISRILRLLKECLPLCIGTTLGVFAGNIPKYLIDNYLDESVQAYFGYIMMPAFAIMLLSSFIFQPIIKDIGVAYQKGEMGYVKKTVQRQILLIVMITLVVIIGGVYVGIPILGALYHIELFDYEKEMLVLIIGGGCYAVAQFIMVPIVVLRKQKDIAIIYATVVIFAIIIGSVLVQDYGIMGASALYLIINILLSGILFGDYAVRIKNEGQKRGI